MEQESLLSIGLTSPDGETCATLEHTTSPRVISSVAVFHARTLATPESAPVSTENGQGSGASTPVSFANYDPATCLWRTSQHCLDGALAEYSATWPRAGTMQNGSVYRRARSVLHIHENDCSLWPTPLASEGMGGGTGKRAQAILDGKSSSQLRVRDLYHLRYGVTMPTEFAEHLLGFPQNWTVLED